MWYRSKKNDDVNIFIPIVEDTAEGILLAAEKYN
jgi:hypothetical protein